MAQSVSVDSWRQSSGRTNEVLAGELDISVRSLIRYLNRDRDWPFAVTKKLKKLSRGVLTDDSFEKGRSSRAA